MGYTRWDPRSRAGAVHVARRKGAIDVMAVEAISENLADWARYLDLDGECDMVETSSVSGTYDWRAYLQEETQIAQRREAAAKPRDKKAEPPAREPAPHVFYA